MAIAVDDPALVRSKRWRRKVVNRIFKTYAKLSLRVSRLRRRRSSVEVIENLAYGPHPFNRLDVYRPVFAPRPLPVMLYIHGGAFFLCSKETHRAFAHTHAAHAGYLVFNIDYRLAPNYRFPAAHADACAAYVWVVENCARFGGDPSRIVVAGESAGGNLALSVAVASSYERPEPWARAVFETQAPCAVQPIMPYLQVSNPARQAFNPGAGYFSVNVAHDIANAYLGPHRAQASTETLMADPIRVLEECGAPQRAFPRVFSGVGTADICCEDVQRLEAACTRHGIDGAFHYYEDEFHAFHAIRWREATRRFWADTFGFLREFARPQA
jgi:acetyl esterase